MSQLVKPARTPVATRDCLSLVTRRVSRRGRLRAPFGAARLLGGQCIITATLDERGHAVLLGPTATLTFGELTGTLSRRIDAIATTMQDAGFVVQVSNAVLLEMWEKWVLLATFAGMTCLMRGAIGDIVAAGAAGLTEALLEECRHIAASQDQVIRPEVLQRIRTLLTQAGSTIMASMLRDVERGAMTEADHVLGDLLHRRSASAGNSPSLLQIAYTQEEAGKKEDAIKTLKQICDKFPKSGEGSQAHARLNDVYKIPVTLGGAKE